MGIVPKIHAFLKKQLCAKIEICAHKQLIYGIRLKYRKFMADEKLGIKNYEVICYTLHTDVMVSCLSDLQ
jgi:hypothetical protein